MHASKDAELTIVYAGDGGIHEEVLMTDLGFRGALELIGMMQRNEISSRELLEHQLERVARHNGSINAIVTLDPEGARAQADEADERRARGGPMGALHGLPMTIKDTYEVAGMRTTAGAPQYADHVPELDATAVERVRGAGAVIFGKTNVPLMAGDWQSYNEIFGTTSSPWDLARTPGGSSGGAAAALAAGLTPLEVGSDIGGSVRVPSHWSGICGHKPSWGIVPQRGHIPPAAGALLTRDLNVVGPLARSVDDLELALDVLAGPDELSATAWRLELPPARHRDLRDYRVAAWLDDPAYPVDGEVRERLESAVEALRRDGVKVDDRAHPPIELREAVRNYQWLLMSLEGAEFPPELLEGFRKFAAEADPEDTSEVLQLARAATASHKQWLDADEVRERTCRVFEGFFRDWDVLLCPVNAVPPILHDHEDPIPARRIRVNGEERPYIELLGWVATVTMCRLPATVFPVGRTTGNLPVGVQIVGPYLEDRTTLQFARRLGELIGGFEPPPGY